MIFYRENYLFFNKIVKIVYYNMSFDEFENGIFYLAPALKI